ncbi:MAG: dephospho-CoA kinase [Planctomycetes bacterium]|nr:dephospho-CoA kinase [Planctomycetota bacterium]
MRKKIIIIGISGGIGSGKSTVARLFKKAGAKIIDADKIGHAVLSLRGIQKKLVSCFGKGVISKSNRVNRQYLGRQCFLDKKNIANLNNLVHPLIRKEIKKQIKAYKKGMVILDAALLMEKGLYKICDYLVFVDAPYKTRLKRVVMRNWSKSELARREKFQASLSTKRKKSGFIIYNQGDLNNTKQQVLQIIKQISERS